MTRPPPEDPKEIDAQKTLLGSPIGLPGSGYDRYAAAMYFYNRGAVSGQLLEIFRRCCKYDEEDPIDLARHEGITVDMDNIYSNSQDETN